MSKLIFTFIIISSFCSNIGGQEYSYDFEDFGINDIIRDDYVVDIEEGKNGRIYWVNRRQILLNESGGFTEIFDLSGYP